MKIYCISGKAQHGKDTLAGFMLEVLENRGKSVLIFHYADLLKYIAKQYFGWDGVKDENGRHLLQELGTDVIRAKNPNYWVQFAAGFLRMFEDRWDYALIPDSRFPNEIDYLKEAGFDVSHIRVVRPTFDNGLAQEQKWHPSEIALDHVEPDYVIMNDGSLTGFKEYIEELLVPALMHEESKYTHIV